MPFNGPYVTFSGSHSTAVGNVIDDTKSEGLEYYNLKLGTGATGSVDFSNQKLTIEIEDDELQSVHQYGNKNNFKVFPTVFYETITIKPQDKITFESVKILSANGAEYQVGVSSTAGGIYTLNVAHLASGMYFIEINDSNNEKVIYKMIKP